VPTVPLRAASDLVETPRQQTTLALVALAQKHFRRPHASMVKVRTIVEPPEPMRGMEVPEVVVDSPGGGKRTPDEVGSMSSLTKSRAF
jgi:hypothetical protein